MTVIDLFCGAGGLSIGFEKAGFEVIGVDVDKNSLKTWDSNHEGECFQYDLSEIDPSSIFTEYNIQGIIGGPPCQGFSDARGRRDISDERNSLVYSFKKFIEYHSPEFFLMENVTGIKTIDDGYFFQSLIDDYKRLGYNINHRIVDMSNYGVPQKRKRVIVVGMKNDVFTFPQPSYDSPTVEEALNDIKCEEYEECELENVQYILPGQVFRSNRRGERYVPVWEFYPDEFNLDEKKCLRKVRDGRDQLCDVDVATSLIKRGWLQEDGDRYKFTTKSGLYPHYNRIPLKTQSPTILTSDYRPREKLHPEYNRSLSVKEASALQSFPKKYKFFGTKEEKWKQIANAVPPVFSEIIAKRIDKTLDGKDNGVFSF